MIDYKKLSFFVDEKLSKTFISKRQAYKILDEEEIRINKWKTTSHKGKEISIFIDELECLCVVFGNDKNKLYCLDEVI
jgi:hypothetical protein